MSKHYCLMCRGEVADGKRVAMDPLASFVLSVKRKMGISSAMGRTIVVCHSCMPAYEKARDKFRGKAVQLAFVALVIFAVQAYYVSVWAGLIFAIFILSFLLIYYVPWLEAEEARPSPARAK